ncbi:MAG: hypothetical protein JJ850_08580 [Kordiimonadaceae bacterium]|nr:hypothetical protein [Kordiimonadaceae bacterium]MBO6569183.1 hypothetical protein [Kordiimonadaceae bacterium]MBO6964659.1 hypothetical protein [Kordiimonadaceae bacterium]
MKRLFGILFITLSWLAVPLAGGPVSSAVFQDHEDAREALKRGAILPYSRIKKIIESQVGGKVVGQKLRRTNQGWQYDLRVRPENGRVMVLVVDARTGAIVSRR